MNPPSDCATSTRSRRVGADRVDDGVGVFGEPSGVVVTRQIGRDDLVTRARSLGATRCQYQESDPAPGMRQNVLISRWARANAWRERIGDAPKPRGGNGAAARRWRMDDRRNALAGVLAAAVALAITSLADALVAGIPSLIGAVGQTFLRAAPGSFAQLMIELLGYADKPALRVGTLVIALLVGAGAGRAAARRAWVGDVIFAVFGAIGVASAASLDGMSVPGATLSAGLGVLAGLVSLRWLLAPRPPSQGAIAVPGHGVDRRRFLSAAGVVAVAVGGARAASPRGAATDEAARRYATKFGGPIAEQGIPVDGLSPLITPNDRFYRTDEALIVPDVDVARWRLRVAGMVDRPFELTFDELVALPLVEASITLACVSNEVGGSLVGNARWTGVRLDALLERAGVDARADQIVGRSVDGFTAGFPVSIIDGRDALVAVAMNGQPLPRIHGFPARLVVPGLYGYVSATKWLKEIHLTTFESFDAYWAERGWSRLGPVKLESRIDVPRDASSVDAGRRVVAGVAWAPHRAIAKVEIRVDKGPWQETELGPSLGDDAWRQWRYDWTAAAGEHEIEVRATTTDGEVQTAASKPPFPSGATGHHRIRVEVS